MRCAERFTPTRVTPLIALALGLGLVLAVPAAAGLRVVATIPVGRGPCCVLAQAGSVWVGNHRDNTISRVDPTTNTVLQTVRVARRTENPGTGSLSAMVGGDGAIWVLVAGDKPRLVRVNAASRVVSQLGAAPPDVGPIAYRGGSLWIGSMSTSVLRRVDAKTGKVTGRWDLFDQAVYEMTSIVVAPDAVWVATTQGEVIRIDPRRGKIVARVHAVGDGFDTLALAGGSVWATVTGKPLVVRIDTRRNAVATRIHVMPAGDRDAFPVVFAGGDGSVWVQPGPAGLLELDPRTGKVARTVELPVDRPITDYWDSGLAVAFGSVWVGSWPDVEGGYTAPTRGALLRFDL